MYEIVNEAKEMIKKYGKQRFDGLLENDDFLHAQGLFGRITRSYRGISENNKNEITTESSGRGIETSEDGRRSERNGSNDDGLSQKSVRQDIQQAINESMTMQKCEQMIRRAFILGNVRDYDGYKTPKEWIEAEGASAVALICDNEYSIQTQFINQIPGIMNDDFYIEDVLEAYLAGTLTGKVAQKKVLPRVDIGKSGVTVADERFYAPKAVQQA